MTATSIGFAKITRDITERRAAQEALVESERRFRLLVQGVADYAIYMLDPSGMVSNWNAGAERIKGYRAEEIVGQHFSVFYTEEDRSGGLPPRALADAQPGKGRFEAEGWRVRKDGTRFLASRGDRRDPRRARRADRLRQDHARHHRAAEGRRTRCARASGSSACWSSGVTDYALYMLDPNGNVTNWNAGAERDQGLCAAARSSVSTSRASTPSRDRACGRAGAGARDRARRGPVRGGRLARAQGRHVASGPAS